MFFQYKTGAKVSYIISCQFIENDPCGISDEHNSLSLHYSKRIKYQDCFIIKIYSHEKYKF